MDIKIGFNIDSDAFGSTLEDRAQASEKILIEAAEKIRRILPTMRATGTSWPIFDVNGNEIGRVLIARRRA